MLLIEENKDYTLEVRDLSHEEHIQSEDCIHQIIRHLLVHRQNVKNAALADKRLQILKHMLKVHQQYI
ncbi:MAG: hypothetical protein RIC35_12390 [Marinoscillum sp.]